MKRLLCLIVPLLMGIYPAVAQEPALRVVATTTLVADVAAVIGGERTAVTALVPADADTHAFTPTPQDVALVAAADLLLAVGAGYEGFLGDLIEAAGDKALLIVSDGVLMLPFAEGEHDHEAESAADEHSTAEPIGVLGEEGVCEDDHEQGAEGETDADEDEHGACDPHVWTDPRNVMTWAVNLAVAFSVADPAGAALYAANAEAYRAQLADLDAEIRLLVEAVPAERRILVTNHEFMGYFAQAYGFELVGAVIPGGTTDGTADPQALADLVELIVDEGVPAIFAEVSADTRLAATIASEAGITVVTTLYSESLSAADGPAASYLDYMRYNAHTVIEALR